MKVIDVVSFFAFDKFNSEHTKLLNSHYEPSHSPIAFTIIEIIPSFSRDSFYIFSFQLAY